jgi:2-C-methyl-D-erythritol 2,4-cyclodiphosphate synthase
VNIRTGIGYDVHRFSEGRPLVLGGVAIPGERGLAGHSDADVLVHAIVDAMLGAAALGDIGRHFPDDNEEFRGAESLNLLRWTLTLLDASGWRPVNVDSTIIAERPRLAPYIDAMRAAVAAAAGLEVDSVSVKATTNEGLGALGAGQGIAAFAVALIERGSQPAAPGGAQAV